MKYMSIAYGLICLVMVIVTLNFVNWHREQVVEFEQTQMDIQVNYCIDAALQEILDTTSDIETDYVDYRYMEVNPTIAFSVYVDMLLRNLGWGDTKENRNALITDYIPFFIVCGYDGYYICSKQPVNFDHVIMDGDTEKVVKNIVYDLVWTPKIPYAQPVWNEAVGDFDYEAYNLANKTFIRYSKDSAIAGSGYTLYEDLEVTPDVLIRAKSAISKCVSEACTSALTSSLEGKTDIRFYIPAEMGSWIKSSTIDAPTLITYVDLMNVKNKMGAQVFGIGGAAVSESRRFIAYVRDGVKCYTYSDNRADVESKGYVVDEVYSSREEAAKNGYWFDINYIK